MREYKDIQYDIDTETMRLQGIDRKYSGIKFQFGLTLGIFLALLTFFIVYNIIARSMYVSYMISYILNPIYSIILILYFLFVFLKSLQNLLINSEIDYFKELALRKNLNSLANERADAMMKLNYFNYELSQLEELNFH